MSVVDPSPLPDAAVLGATRLVHLAEVSSTMDVVHEEAGRGAPAGLVVVADRQSAGRGRSGNAWVSEPGAGVWLTVLERQVDPMAASVLSLRLGLALADALDAFSPAPIRLKWPNDLFGDEGKLAGILVESRWREGSIEWIAIGVGVNLHKGMSRSALREGTTRADVLCAIVPAMRGAAATRGVLSDTERVAWAARDAARGQAALEPVRGIVSGIASDGALQVHDGTREVAVASGSLVFRDADWWRRPPATVAP